MRKKYSLLIALSLFSILVQSQDVFKFAIHFTDKDHTPFSIHQPEEFLSQRSIDRRAKFNIGYVEADLPIDPVYIQDVLGATADAHIMIQVKWLNTIIISLSDSANISIIEKLPIVDKIECVLNPNLISKGIDKFSLPTNDLENSFSSYKGVQDYDTAFYGGGWEQIHQMNGEVLHQQGYRGQGMIIAVLDAGFVNVDSLDVFKPLWDNDQILGTKSFVNPGQTVFGYSGHGSYVLSTMGGYWEGQLVGTAPEASYWLLRTEDTS
ncbi:MAG: serine protease, partial [Bacteroidales bacterium]|nr:serine protease [Bacteroidales bacterium]